MSIGWRGIGATNVGRRRRGNEDAYHTDLGRGIFLVADGMGGHAAGEVASELASATVAQTLAAARDSGAGEEELLGVLRNSSHVAHDAIVHCCADDKSFTGMGTTLTACVLDRAGTYLVGHIGDSRLYRYRGGTLEQITHDHTWVQREIDQGRLTPSAAKRHPLSHILTRVLSEDSDPEMDVVTGTAEPGDLLLLVTDGLYNMIDDEKIARIVGSDAELPDRATALIRAANRAGGADNITVVLVEVLAGDRKSEE